MVEKLLDTKLKFPPYHRALSDPDGLIAVGGKLTPDWLVTAYKNGIFPWSIDDDKILWWCPSERAVLVPGEMKVSRSLQKTLRKKKFTIQFDYNFNEIINQCANNANRSDETWITKNMIQAYCKLHDLGISHSIGVYEEDKLVGGLYGVGIGRIFCGESMFQLSSDASKVAFYYLQEYLKKLQFKLIDCQMMNPHLESLGVKPITRQEFMRIVKANLDIETNCKKWIFQ
jgi:leucyl/phenylalanyl-tRNA---protein transferase